MQFLTVLECQGFAARLGIPVPDLTAGARPTKLKKTLDFFYDSPLRTATEVAQNLVEHLGNFDAALLRAHGLVWGDRSLDADPPPAWKAYRLWRRAHGELRRLYDAPGHLFDTEERGDLVAAIEFAIQTGWDTLIVPHPTRCIINLSHDDLVTIHSRANRPGIVPQLEALGFRRVRLGSPDLRRRKSRRSRDAPK
ncbi:MAG: hypothetical protein JO366_15310 [Methylobacteriaceae bacterium]|nr:hypothetical protein [Methylobacteriaceae bacterium]